MTKVELFEAIRRDHFVHGKSKRRIARERGVHRRMVRQALNDAVPPERKVAERKSPVLTTHMQARIDEWLQADKKAPKKQRHTARRIFHRLVQEEGFQGAESTVRRHVGRRRRELSIGVDVFVPLCHPPGEEAEVDWYEAYVDFPSGRQKVYGFAMRACYSGKEFHVAFPRATQQAFLEAHVLAFEWFGGVFATVRYDNLGSAVKKVLRGRRRQETERFVTLRSHYLFESEFCRVGKAGAHEKGGVEGGLGRFRRNHLVPVPKVDDFNELNRMLHACCDADDERTVSGQHESISRRWQREQPLLKPLPSDPFGTAEVGTLTVSAKSMVCLRTNRYSVPVRLARRKVEYRLHATSVDLVAGGKVVATHKRLQQRHGVSVVLDHYLELLWRKPGALARSLPLQQARQTGSWPESYDQLLERLIDRYDRSEAARHLLAIMLMHREHAAEDVHRAVAGALTHGCYDAHAVATLLRQQQQAGADVAALTGLGRLHEYDRALPTTSHYNALLSRSAKEPVH